MKPTHLACFSRDASRSIRLGAIGLSLLACCTGCGGNDSPSSTGDIPDAGPSKPELPTVTTNEGPVVGVHDPARRVWVFKGIPFAAPPVGDLRWRSPQPPPLRSEPLDASQFGNACLQIPETATGATLGAIPPSDEDCLTLNVWLPETLPETPLPVLVWFHGGGFVLGAGSQSLYDGALLAQQGLAVVTVNYRLGALGFMTHQALIGEEGRPSAGNYGTLDQIAALRWVQDNIANFNADPNRVTIVGESAGGVSVCTLLASPLTGGLFHAAIDQSGPCLSDIAISDLTQTTSAGPPAVDQGARVATALGCDTAPDVLGCLRGKTGAEVMKARPNAVFLSAVGAETWKPIIDHHVLEQSVAKAIKSGQAQKVPLLIGVTADEGPLLVNAIGATPSETVNQQLVAGLIGDTKAMQVLAHYAITQFGGNATKQLAAIIGDGVFLCPTERAALDHFAAGNSVFAYQFTHITSIGSLLMWGAFHGSDVPFVWGNPPEIVTGQPIMPTATEVQLIAAMQAYWASFATTGKPAGTGLPDWPPFDATSESRMDLDIPLASQPGWPHPADCAMWQSVLGADL